MILAIAVSVSAMWATVDLAMPWIVEQQIKLEQYLEQQDQLAQQRERDRLELYIEDHLLNNGNRPLPEVIVTPIGEPEAVKQRITIKEKRDVE